MRREARADGPSPGTSRLLPASSGGRPSGRRRPCAARRRRRSRSSRAAARWSATVSLRSGARVEDALRGSATRCAIDVGADLVERLQRGAWTSRSSRCTAAAARTDRPGAAGARRHPVHGLAAGRRASAARQGRGQAPLRDAGIPTPDFYAFTRRRSRSSGAPRRCPRSRSGSASRWWSSPPARARRWASSSRRTAADGRPRWSRPSPTTRRCCSSATSRAGSSRFGARPTARPCRSSRRSRRGGLLRLRRALQDRAHALRVPRRARRRR